MNAVIALTSTSSSRLDFEMNIGWRRKEDLEGEPRFIKTSGITHLDSPCVFVQIGFYTLV